MKKQSEQSIVNQAKELGIKVDFAKNPILRRSGYKRGSALTEGHLRALKGKQVPVWVEYETVKRKHCEGVFFVEDGCDDECVMLEDGTSFPLDFQLSGDDNELCGCCYDDHKNVMIYEAKKKST
jgi:hypothetical protein